MLKKHLYRIFHRRSIQLYTRAPRIEQAAQEISDLFANSMEALPTKPYSKKLKCIVTLGARWNYRLGAQSLKGIQYNIHITDAGVRKINYIHMTDPYLIDFQAEELEPPARSFQINYFMTALEHAAEKKIRDRCKSDTKRHISRISVNGTMESGYIDISYTCTIKNEHYHPGIKHG